ELYGAWQIQPGNSGDGNRRLLIWSRTPYDAMQSVTDSATPQLEEADSYDPCNPLGPPIVVDFEAHPNAFLAPNVGDAYAEWTWPPGMLGATVEEFERATAGKDVAPGLPRAYYRTLSLPDQFGLVTAPAGGGVAGGGTSTMPVAAPPLRIQFPRDVGAVTVLV